LSASPEPLRKPAVSYEWITPFDKSGPEHVYENVTYDDGYIRGEDVIQTRFECCTFTKVVFDRIVKCLFVQCKFERCNWEKSLTDTHFKECHMTQQDFSDTRFQSVDLRDSKLIESHFSNDTSFAEVALLNVSGLETSWKLHDVEVIPGTHHAWQIELNNGIERISLPWLTRRTSWTVLRSFGKLPFFGVSYAGLVGIPMLMFLISVYNDQIENLKSLGDRSGEPGVLLAGHLHPIAVPSLNLLLLLSLVLLAVASTIFAFACPPRIKEFSYERWVDEFRRPGIQYLPLGWQHPLARAICGVCYPAGALGTAVVLFWKTFGTAIYIVQHSPLPWMLK
jgi:Pentapeptide repeats (8 copies)